MKPKFFSSFSIESFLEQSYAIFFGILLLLTIGTTTFIFYSFSYQTTAPSKEAIVQPSDIFNESIVLNINELLDIREERFNQLRKLRPAIKNPF